jgi:hypothetical protein
MSRDKGPDLCYVRGDTAPLTLIFKQSAVAIDLTGYTAIVLTTNTEQDPTDITNQQFQMDGALTATPTDGTINFKPQGIDESAKRTASEAYPVDAEMFYDVQAIDGTGARVSLIYEGKFDVLQDITKD